MSKLIGEGGFGCVYYPHFNCEGKITSSKNFVSKIQIYDKTVVRELQIGKLISKIPYYNLHFAPIIKSCKVNIASFDNKSLLQDCEIVKNNSDDNFILSTISYVKGPEFKDYIGGLRENELYISVLFNSYYYLLNSLQILYNKNICHYDIKFENIVYDTFKKFPIIIDFGLSFSFDDIENYSSINSLKNFFYIYAPRYYIWCPEIQIISYLIKHNNKNNDNKNNDNKNNDIILTKTVLKTILQEIVEGMNIWDLFSLDFKKKYLENLYSFYSKFINKENDYIIKELLKYKSTWDTYSLSISFLKEFIYKLNKSSNLKNDKSILLIVIQLLLYSLSPYPSKRPAISTLTEILYNTFNEKFPQSIERAYLNFSLTDYEYKYITTKIIPNLYFFINK